MKPPEVKARVDDALKEFMRVDAYLLTHDLSERCIASRVAFHLQQRFPDYSVDVEYNRAGETPKRLNLPVECANFTDGDGLALVVPDLIIHCRGPEGPNILGIEIKKAGDPRGSDCDRKRIHALMSELRYSCGALLECETRPGREPSIVISEWL